MVVGWRARRERPVHGPGIGRSSSSHQRPMRTIASRGFDRNRGSDDSSIYLRGGWLKRCAKVQGHCEYASSQLRALKYEISLCNVAYLLTLYRGKPARFSAPKTRFLPLPVFSCQCSCTNVHVPMLFMYHAVQSLLVDPRSTFSHSLFQNTVIWKWIK